MRTANPLTRRRLPRAKLLDLSGRLPITRPVDLTRRDGRWTWNVWARFRLCGTCAQPQRAGAQGACDKSCSGKLLDIHWSSLLSHRPELRFSDGENISVSKDYPVGAGANPLGTPSITCGAVTCTRINTWTTSASVTSASSDFRRWSSSTWPSTSAAATSRCFCRDSGEGELPLCDLIRALPSGLVIELEVPQRSLSEAATAGASARLAQRQACGTVDRIDDRHVFDGVFRCGLNRFAAQYRGSERVELVGVGGTPRKPLHSTAVG
jgi:hypothetical protein